jgi:hypothetical protein
MHRSGKYRINYDSSLPITVTPREGFLPTGRGYVYDSNSTEALTTATATTSTTTASTAVVIVEFDAVRWQQLQAQALQVPFCCIATLECDGCLNSNTQQFKRIIDISAAVQQQRLQLLGGEGGPLSDLNFGELYFGGKKEIVASLFNRGPTAATFTAAIDCVTDADSGGSSGGDDTLNKVRTIYWQTHKHIAYLLAQ